MHRLKKSLTACLGLALLSLPASAANTQSLTKTISGVSYKLTWPKPLHTGEHKLILRLTRGASPLKSAGLKALATMDDGMQSAVKITPKGNGDYELKTLFDMGGEWQLKIQQTAPVASSALFLLDVGGGHH